MTAMDPTHLNVPAASTGGPLASLATLPVDSGRYVLGMEIARGGMGVVYRATDNAIGREVAIKVLHDKYASTSAAARRFADEARIAGQLQHPGIPPIHDLGILSGGRPFLAMKLIKGETLDDMLKDRRDTSDDRGRFVAAFEQVCQAIAYAHAHKVIHRDLKPANIMVGNYGEVQVMDWGLAKVLGGPAAEHDDPEMTAGTTEVQSLRDTDGEFTQAGSVLGTPAFMPPEQAVGAVSQVNERSDVFGLGAVLAVILTGKPPFAGDSAETTRILAAQGKVDPCFERLNDCGADPDLVALCKQCLAPNIADRPMDAGVVAKAVAELRQAADERARLAELDKVRAEGEKLAAEVQVAEQRKRRQVQAALGIAFTALVMLGAAFAWWAQDQRRTRRELAEQEVNQAIEKAVAQFAQARGADRDLALWAEARAAALQAQEHAANAPAEVQKRVREMLAEIEQVEKNRRLVATLIDIQASMGDDVDEMGAQDFSGASDRYGQAFRDYGVDLDQLSSEQSAELLSNLGGRSNVELAAALDDWVYVRYMATRRMNSNAKTEATRLFLVTRLLDADPLRNQIRDAIQNDDYPGLTRLSEELDLANQPVQTTNLVSVWHLHVGQTFIRADRTDRNAATIRFLRKAQPYHPGDFQINHNLAYFLRMSGQFAESLPYQMASIAVRPRSAAAWLSYAKSLAGLKSDAEAVKAFQRACELAPRAWPYLISAGEILEGQGKISEAVAEYRKAAAGAVKFPSSNGYSSYKIKKWMDHGLSDEVTNGLRETTRLDPKNAKAHALLTELLLEVGDLPGAESEARETIKVDHLSTSSAFGQRLLGQVLLGQVLLKKGDTDGAIAAFKESMDFRSENPISHTSLVSLLQYRGNLAAAEAAAREFIKLHPDIVAAHSSLEQVLREKGDPAEAEAAAREFVRLHPKNAEAHSSLGQVLRQNGNLDGAIVEFREALVHQPEYSYANSLLVFLLLQTGDLAGAEEVARTFLELPPETAYAHRSLGSVLQQKGDLDSAIAETEKALQLDSNDSIAASSLAQFKRQREILPQLPDVLAGKIQPQTAAEACEFAELCTLLFQSRFADAVHLYEKAFAEDSQLANDPAAFHTYNAACCAARAARGDGIDAPVDPAAMAILRGQALGWLRAHLASLRTQANSSEADLRTRAITRLSHMLQDADLLATHPRMPRTEMSASEREEWDALWADTAAALAEAQKPLPPIAK